MRVLVAAATPLQEFLLKGRVELGRTEHRLLVDRAGYVRVKHFVMGRRAPRTRRRRDRKSPPKSPQRLVNALKSFAESWPSN
jgi:hypothetical protein